MRCAGGVGGGAVGLCHLGQIRAATCERVKAGQDMT